MLLSQKDIRQGLIRLGELVAQDGQHLRLILVGGAVMSLAYDARASTRDIDAIFLSPPEASEVRNWASQVAVEFNWEDDWLNDGAKGFLQGLKQGKLLLQSDGIKVWQVAPEQLLAMKLSAWRDDTDINDAKRLLQEFQGLNAENIWIAVEPFVQPHFKQKARYALEDVLSNDFI
jgi:predicted nucleotidyltransferase